MFPLEVFPFMKYRFSGRLRLKGKIVITCHYKESWFACYVRSIASQHSQLVLPIESDLWILDPCHINTIHQHESISNRHKVTQRKRSPKGQLLWSSKILKKYFGSRAVFEAAVFVPLLGLATPLMEARQRRHLQTECRIYVQIWHHVTWYGICKYTTSWYTYIHSTYIIYLYTFFGVKPSTEPLLLEGRYVWCPKISRLTPSTFHDT